MTVDLLVVRHAQSVWNVAGRWQGHADPPLSADGVAQARTVAERNSADGLADVCSVVSSDLTRARQTAEIIAEVLRVQPVVCDSEWRERDVGLWQGLTGEEIERDYPGALAAGNYPPGWESQESLIERVLTAANRIGERVCDGVVLVVSHAGVIYVLQQHFGVNFGRTSNLNGLRLRVESGEVSLQERVVLDADAEADDRKPTATTERQ